jgi:hypothetical protein
VIALVATGAQPLSAAATFAAAALLMVAAGVSKRKLEWRPRGPRRRRRRPDR